MTAALLVFLAPGAWAQDQPPVEIPPPAPLETPQTPDRGAPEELPPLDGLLAGQWRPLDEQEYQGLVEALDTPSWRERERATGGLIDFGPGVLALVERSLSNAAALPLETHWRLLRVRARLQVGLYTPRVPPELRREMISFFVKPAEQRLAECDRLMVSYLAQHPDAVFEVLASIVRCDPDLEVRWAAYQAMTRFHGRAREAARFLGEVAVRHNDFAAWRLLARSRAADPDSGPFLDAVREALARGDDPPLALQAARAAARARDWEAAFAFSERALPAFTEETARSTDLRRRFVLDWMEAAAHLDRSAQIRVPLAALMKPDGDLWHAQWYRVARRALEWGWHQEVLALGQGLVDGDFAQTAYLAAPLRSAIALDDPTAVEQALARCSQALYHRVQERRDADADWGLRRLELAWRELAKSEAPRLTAWKTVRAARLAEIDALVDDPNAEISDQQRVILKNERLDLAFERAVEHATRQSTPAAWQALAPLQQDLNNVRARWWTLVAARVIADDRAQTLLIEHAGRLDDVPTDMLGHWAWTFLADVPGDRIDAFLIDHLAGEDPALADRAAIALGWRGVDRAAPAILTLVLDENRSWTSRRLLAGVLIMLEAPQTLLPLEKFLRSALEGSASQPEELHALLVEALLRQGKSAEEAAPHADAALEAWARIALEDASPERSRRAQALSSQAWMLCRMGRDADQALRFCQEALDLGFATDNAASWEMLAYVHSARGEAEAAFRAAHMALEQTPAMRLHFEKSLKGYQEALPRGE